MKKVILSAIGIVALTIFYGEVSNAQSIVQALPDSDTTITENYLIVEKDNLFRAAPKTIKVSGQMMFDKASWITPPKHRNWKEKRSGFWYYGKLNLQSYNSAGPNLWLAKYSGTLTR